MFGLFGDVGKRVKYEYCEICKKRGAGVSYTFRLRANPKANLGISTTIISYTDGGTHDLTVCDKCANSKLFKTLLITFMVVTISAIIVSIMTHFSSYFKGSILFETVMAVAAIGGVVMGSVWFLYKLFSWKRGIRLEMLNEAKGNYVLESIHRSQLREDAEIRAADHKRYQKLQEKSKKRLRKK